MHENRLLHSLLIKKKKKLQFQSGLFKKLILCNIEDSLVSKIKSEKAFKINFIRCSLSLSLHNSITINVLPLDFLLDKGPIHLFSNPSQTGPLTGIKPIGDIMRIPG